MRMRASFWPSGRQEPQSAPRPLSATLPVPIGPACRRKVEMSAFPQSPWHREDCEIGPERSCHSPHHRARSHRGLVPTQMVKCPPCTGPHSSRGDEGKRHVNSKRLPLPSRESQGYTVSYSWERGWLLTGPARGKPGGGAHANADVQPERGASVVGL